MFGYNYKSAKISMNYETISNSGSIFLMFCILTGKINLKNWTSFQNLVTECVSVHSSVLLTMVEEAVSSTTTNGLEPRNIQLKSPLPF